MAVQLVHCSCFLPRSDCCNIFRRRWQSDHFSAVIPISGKLSSLQLKKLISFYGSSSSRAFMIHQALLGSRFMNLEQDGANLSVGEQNCGLDDLQSSCNTTVEYFSAHQRISAVALIVTSTLMLATPLEALAESCEADQSFFNMPLLLLVALIGATVGGLLARQRRGELQRLNEQLRQINAALRRQAKIESYAPTLSYAPVGGRIADNEIIVDPRKQELISHLKIGKNYLRNQDPEKAFLEFTTALELAQIVQDPIEEKKAARGLGAALQRQGKYREAIKYHSMVLAISEREGEDSGNTEAYGAIADCYTELGDLERAGKYYDQYISRLESD